MCSKRQFVQKFPTKSTLTDLDGLQTNLNGPYDWGLSGVAFNRISIFERIKRKWTQSRLSWTKLRSVSKIWYFPEFIAWVSSKTDFDEGRFRLLDSHRSNLPVMGVNLTVQTTQSELSSGSPILGPLTLSLCFGSYEIDHEIILKQTIVGRTVEFTLWSSGTHWKSSTLGFFNNFKNIRRKWFPYFAN